MRVYMYNIVDICWCCRNSAKFLWHVLVTKYKYATKLVEIGNNQCYCGFMNMILHILLYHHYHPHRYFYRFYCFYRTVCGIATKFASLERNHFKTIDLIFRKFQFITQNVEQKKKIG